jgi:hypothetical protein
MKTIESSEKPKIKIEQQRENMNILGDDILDKSFSVEGEILSEGLTLKKSKYMKVTIKQLKMKEEFSSESYPLKF